MSLNSHKPILFVLSTRRDDIYQDCNTVPYNTQNPLFVINIDFRCVCVPRVDMYCQAYDSQFPKHLWVSETTMLPRHLTF